MLSTDDTNLSAIELQVDATGKDLEQVYDILNSNELVIGKTN